MYRFISVFALFLFGSALSFAQNSTLSGTIRDASTNEALVGVTVRSGSTGAVTDIDGNFSLSLSPGRHAIEVSYIGYTSLKRNIVVKAEGTRLDLSLNDDTNLLQQATVTAGKFEKPLGEVTVSLEVIKPAFIENNNANTIEDALDKVPGVTIIDGQANIRGGSGFSYGAGSRVLLLLNDLPALQVDAGFPNWNDFPVENIGQVEILKGASSALYGSSAMNGIINVRTGYAKGDPETEAALFSTVWGAPKEKGAKWWGTDSTIAQPYQVGMNFVHRRKEGKMDIVLGGFASSRKEYNQATFADYVRVTPNFRYRITDRLSVGLNSTLNFGKSGDFFVWANDTTGFYQPGLNSARENKGRYRHVVDPFLHYFDKQGNRHKLLGRYYFINNKNDSNQGNKSNTYYGEYQFQRNFEDIGLVTTAGIVGSTANVTAELYSNSEFTVNNTAAYLQLDQKLWKKLNLSGGVRYERNQLLAPDSIPNLLVPDSNLVESKPVFRLGANYQLGKATYLRASWGQGYRFPTIAERFISTTFGELAAITPNPSLISETGWTAEIGLKQGFAFGSWKGFTDLTFFQSEYTNMMEFSVDGNVPPGFLLALNSQNVGDTRISGVEFSILGQGDIGGGTLQFWTGYTYLDPKFIDFNEFQMNNSSSSENILKYRYKHSAKADVEFSQGKFSIGTNVNYVSFMEAVDWIFEAILPGVKNYRAENNHGTLLIDGRIGYQITPELKARFLCSNIMNVENPIRPAIMGAPRGYTLRLEYKLK